jgi:hypothetical protein
MAKLIYSAIASADGYVEDAAGSFGVSTPRGDAGRSMPRLVQGRTAPSKFDAYQEELMLTFSTVIPGCGASIR